MDQQNEEKFKQLHKKWLELANNHKQLAIKNEEMENLLNKLEAKRCLSRVCVVLDMDMFFAGKQINQLKNNNKTSKRHK